MPILFLSDSGLQGELLFSMISEALPFTWEKSEIGKQRHNFQNYQAIVIDCFQLDMKSDTSQGLQLLKNINHAKTLLINFPTNIPNHITAQLNDQKIQWICDSKSSQLNLVKLLGVAIQSSGNSRHDDTKNRLLLTKREQEILVHLTTGEPNSIIASNLHLSEHTVKNHMYNIFRKIGVKNRLQASNWAKLYLQADHI